MKSSIFILVLFCLSKTISAQITLSLGQCYEMVDEKNRNVQNARIDREIAEINVQQSKLNYLPNLNLGATHGYNWGQSIDPFTNQFASDRVRTNNLYAGGSLPVFNGLANIYNSKITKLDLALKKEELAVVRRNEKLAVTEHYLKVILNNLQIKEAEQKIEQSQQLLTLAKEKHTLKYVTEDELMIASSQLSMDSSLLIQAKNNKKYNLEQLKQLLSMEGELSVEEIIFDNLISTQNFDTLSIEKSPEQRIGDLNQQINDYRVKQKKSELMPRFNLNSSIGTGYSGNNQEIVANQLQPKPLDVQLEENFYQTAVITLAIPVFTNGRTRAAIKIAEAESEQYELERERLIGALKNQFLEILTNIQNNTIRASALQKSVLAYEKRYSQNLEKYEAGALNIEFLLQTQDQLSQKRSEYNIAQVTRLFNEKMLLLFLNE